MKKVFYSADYVLTATGAALKNGAVAVDMKGQIVGVYAATDPELARAEIIKHKGVIVPGFVNTHCHLELSHLRGKISRHTGLIPFIQAVMRERGSDLGEIELAMETADREMYEQGIVAVCDHANTAVSAGVKKRSQLHYRTFVECIGFDPKVAEDAFAAGEAVLRQLGDAAASLTAHAPYSVSHELFRRISAAMSTDGLSLSVHNQESAAENQFFRYKTGDFLDFYAALGIDLGWMKPRGKSSLKSFVNYLAEDQQVLLVHNTYTSLQDISFLDRTGRQVTWALCPNANLYIENRLPKLKLFLDSDFPITLGTDSLASNDKLCVLSELKVLHAADKTLLLEETIKWITANGAAFMGLSDVLGTIEVGKKPGLNLLTNMRGLNFTKGTAVQRLV